MRMPEAKQIPKVNSKRRFPRMLVLAIVLAAFGVVVMLGAKYIRSFLAANEQMPTISSGPPAGQEEPPGRIRLPMTSTSGIASGRLLDGGFTTVTRMSDLAEGCREIFESSFVNLSGTPVSAEQVKIANPGEEFEATDAIEGGRPFRRLILSGLGSKTCFVYYE